jgi:ribosomal protein S3AE
MAKTKVLKKEWYPIVAPKLFRNAVIGESHVYDPDKMVGKSIQQNLMNLTNDVKTQNVKINFEVFKVENGKAFTDVTGYNMVQSSIKRLVRRNINKINMSFMVRTKDNKDIRIKPLFITRTLTSGSVATRIRKEAQDFLEKHISETEYDNLASDVIAHKLQSALRSNLNKIHPLRVCEIESMRLLKNGAQAPKKKMESKADKSEGNNIEVKAESKAEEIKADSAEDKIAET